MITKHVFSKNEVLATDSQWAYRKGRSTELLLIHLTETLQRAIDDKLVVGAVFIDCQKAFDCVSHSILLHKLEHNFGITGNLLAWLRDYLSEREQYTVINGGPSEIPKLHTVYHRALYSGSYSSACTQAIYRKQLSLQRRSCTPMILPCTVSGESVDQVTTMLNKALEELALWCKHNSLIPHPKKCGGMILKRNHLIGPLGSLKINQHLIKSSWSSKQLVVTIDNKLTWS